MSVWTVTSAPAAEPLTLAEVKQYLKVTSTSDDALITELIAEARQFVERSTSRALITQTIHEYWDAFPLSTDRNSRVISPMIAPVQSVDVLYYVAEGGTPAAYSEFDSASYTLDNISGGTMPGPARIVKNHGVDWPQTADYCNAVKLTYQAGYGADGADVPGPLKQAIRRLVGIWYYGKDSRNTDEFDAVKALLTPYKLHK